MISYKISPEHRDASQERFRTMGEGRPAGVKELGHWQSVTQLEGWALVEADDSQELFKALRVWTNLNVNQITPVLDQAGLEKAIGG
ncbi:DUF3303 domain-containing protein [Aeoliella sp.]|uniref:DUF3303 domain-containing protein n=1 Tax=Aeoliella sp. TaxID=2795800 RepID=UPI003CCBA909